MQGFIFYYINRLYHADYLSFFIFFVWIFKWCDNFTLMIHKNCLLIRFLTIFVRFMLYRSAKSRNQNLLEVLWFEVKSRNGGVEILQQRLSC